MKYWILYIYVFCITIFIERFALEPSLVDSFWKERGTDSGELVVNKVLDICVASLSAKFTRREVLKLFFFSCLTKSDE